MNLKVNTDELKRGLEKAQSIADRASNPKTAIQTRIENDLWIATTPHCPELSCTHSSEAQAVNGLIDQIREHNDSSEPVAWIETPRVEADENTITRRITGLWPLSVASTEPIKREEPSDG